MYSPLHLRIQRSGRNNSGHPYPEDFSNSNGSNQALSNPGKPI